MSDTEPWSSEKLRFQFEISADGLVRARHPAISIPLPAGPVQLSSLPGTRKKAAYFPNSSISDNFLQFYNRTTRQHTEICSQGGLKKKGRRTKSMMPPPLLALSARKGFLQ